LSLKQIRAYSRRALRDQIDGKSSTSSSWLPKFLAPSKLPLLPLSLSL
jgi:hypothetical protein